MRGHLSHRFRGIALKALAGVLGLIVGAAAVAYAAGTPSRDGGEPAVGPSRGSHAPNRTARIRPPAPLITSHPESIDTAASVSFAFSGPVGARRFQCRLVGATWSPCRSPVTYTGIATGRHTFKVRARLRRALSRSARYSWSRLEPQPFSIVPRLSGLDSLYPGAAPISLPVMLQNPNSIPISVTELRVAVAADPTGCDSATNLELVQSSASSANPVTVPAGGSAAVPSPGIAAPTIQLLDLPFNQDACQDVQFPLSFSGQAHG